jgi:hypothetical protein
MRPMWLAFTTAKARSRTQSFCRCTLTMFGVDCWRRRSLLAVVVAVVVAVAVAVLAAMVLLLMLMSVL